MSESSSPPRRGRPEASAAIWNWNEPAPPPEPTGPIRKRGLIGAAIGLGAAALVFFFLSQVMAFVVAGIAVFNGAAAVLSPTGLFRTIERALGWFAGMVGRALSWALFAPLLYLFFFPFGRLFRGGQKDALKRFYSPSAPTYWRTRDATPSSRERQF